MVRLIGILLLVVALTGCNQNIDYHSANGGVNTNPSTPPIPSTPSTPSPPSPTPPSPTPPSTDTKLSSITLSSGTLSPVFSASVTSYSATVLNSVGSVTVTPTGSGEIKVNGVSVASGNTSGVITLNVGSNTITVVITPTGGSPSTYTIIVTRLAAALANSYYVATSGNNTTGDGSQSKPWRTPGYGATKLKAGDTLIILGGTYILTDYNSDRIVLARSGNSSAPIIIKGETGNRPKLVAKNTAASQSSAGLGQMVDLNNKSYINIENIEFTHDPNASGTEVYVRDCISGNGDHINLKDLYIHHVDQFGINIQDVDTFTIKDSTIEYCGFGAIGSPDMGSGGGWKNITVDGCDLSYNGHYYRGGNDARGQYDRPDGIGLEEGSGPITVNNCLVEHNYGDGIDLKLDSATITNNIVRNNTANGIKIWGKNSKAENCLVYGTGDGALNGWDAMVVSCDDSGTNVQLINNTIHDTGLRQAYSIIVQYNNATPINLTMKNNIFYNSHGEIYLNSSVTGTIQNNLFDRANSGQEITINGSTRTIAQLNALANCSGNISGDPKFVGPVWGGTNGDYTLQSGSPAIDAGTSSGAPPTDLTGASRPQGGGCDMGAYER